MTEVASRTGVSPLLRPFYPALDGLRAVAFLMVFMNHFGAMAYPSTVWAWGWMGVDLFFVLSGFLITGILYDSLQRQDYFRGFYIRRSLRIFPVFYAFWLLMLLLTPFLHTAWNRYNIALAAYVGNFFSAGANLGLHASPLELAYSSIHNSGQVRYINLNHLWSLCVEEQFYLVWPAVLWFVRSRRVALGFCIAVIVADPIFRLFYMHYHPTMVAAGFLYSSTFSRADTLLVGSALALWLRGPCPSARNLRYAAATVFVFAGLLLAVLYSRETSHAAITACGPAVNGFGFTLIALMAAAVLLFAIQPTSAFTRVLQSKPLSYLGRISYGMYFYHGLLAPFTLANAGMLKAHHLSLAVLVLPFATTTVAATLSFRFLESPFLRFKSRFAPRPERIADPQPIRTEHEFA